MREPTDDFTPIELAMVIHARATWFGEDAGIIRDAFFVQSLRDEVTIRALEIEHGVVISRKVPLITAPPPEPLPQE